MPLERITVALTTHMGIPSKRMHTIHMCLHHCVHDRICALCSYKIIIIYVIYIVR